MNDSCFFKLIQKHMEMAREGEVEDVPLPLSPPRMRSMKMAGTNAFGHNIEYVSQAYLSNRYSEIQIQDEVPEANSNRPLPIYLKARAP